MGKFGQRYCVECSKIFEAETRTQLCCSSECEKKRQKLIKKETNKRYRDKIKERFQLMSVVIQTQSYRITELENELITARQELAELKNGNLANEESELNFIQPEIPELSNPTLPDTLDINQDAPETDPQTITIDPVVQEKEAKEDSETKCDQTTVDATNVVANEMQYCERFKCKAMKLPCGQRPDCWEPSACDKTRGLEKPKSFAAHNYDKYATSKSKDADILADVSYGGV